MLVKQKRHVIYWWNKPCDHGYCVVVSLLRGTYIYLYIYITGAWWRWPAPHLDYETVIQTHTGLNKSITFIVTNVKYLVQKVLHTTVRATVQDCQVKKHSGTIELAGGDRLAADFHQPLYVLRRRNQVIHTTTPKAVKVLHQCDNVVKNPKWELQIFSENYGWKKNPCKYVFLGPHGWGWKA